MNPSSCLFRLAKPFLKGIIAVQCMINLNSNAAPNSPLVFQPYLGTRLYSAILESTLVGGKRGLSFYGILSFDEQSGPSQYAVAAAFPFSKVEREKSQGWAWGLGMGQSNFAYEAQIFANPSLRFYEAMLGRTSVDIDNPERSGFGGYFEIAFRDEQLVEGDEYNSLIANYARTIPPHSRSINLRIGAVSGLGGKGFVEQKPSTRFGHSYHFALSAPVLDNSSTTLHLQAKVFAFCKIPNILCGLSVDHFHNRNPVHFSGGDDVENQILLGPWAQIQFEKKYVWSTAVLYSWSASRYRTIRTPIPLVKSSFSIAF